jgi:alpha-amylase
VNIFLDYETFGEHNWKETGIFDFLQHLPGAVLKKTPFKFMTPSEVADTLQPVSAISVPSPISWADEERDITAWLGNELQTAAFEKLYSLSEKVKKCNDEKMNKDWEYLQSSDHFYYMATKFFSDGAVHAYFNPYETPYDAFMNYMNVLSDFEIRVKRCFPDTDEQVKISKLEEVIREKDEIIEKQATEIVKLGKKQSRKQDKKIESAIKEPGTSLKELAARITENALKKQSTSKTAAPAKKTRSSVKKTAPKKVVKKITVRKTAVKKTTKTGNKK